MSVYGDGSFVLPRKGKMDGLKSHCVKKLLYDKYKDKIKTKDWIAQFIETFKF